MTKERYQRLRSRTIAIHVSDDEYQAITERAELCGMTKREYVARRAMDQEVHVVGSPRVQKALKDLLGALIEKIEAIETDRLPESPEFWATIRQAVTIIDGMTSTKKEQDD